MIFGILTIEEAHQGSYKGLSKILYRIERVFIIMDNSNSANSQENYRYILARYRSYLNIFRRIGGYVYGSKISGWTENPHNIQLDEATLFYVQTTWVEI